MGSERGLGGEAAKGSGRVMAKGSARKSGGRGRKGRAEEGGHIVETHRAAAGGVENKFGDGWDGVGDGVMLCVFIVVCLFCKLVLFCWCGFLVGCVGSVVGRGWSGKGSEVGGRIHNSFEFSHSSAVRLAHKMACCRKRLVHIHRKSQRGTRAQLASAHLGLSYSYSYAFVCCTTVYSRSIDHDTWIARTPRTSKLAV